MFAILTFVLFLHKSNYDKSLMRKYNILTPKYPNDERYEDVTFEHKKYKIPTDRPVRIYCDGIFDMFHYGHVRLFEQVKGMFPEVHLIVGVCNDELTTKYKGNTVMMEEERYESVRGCKYVDEVIVDAPWVIDMDFLEKNRIDYVAHDEMPYACVGTDDLYSFVKNRGMFIPTKRAKNISTTGIITRIIKDYDLFLRRQLLRGISYKDLNISIIKREQIRLKNSLLSDVDNVKREIKIAITAWDNFSKRMIKKFKNKFFSVESPGEINILSKMMSLAKSGPSMS